MTASPAQLTPRQGTMAAGGWHRRGGCGRCQGKVAPPQPVLRRRLAGLGSGRATGQWAATGSVSKTTRETCYERRLMAGGALWKVTGPHVAQATNRALLLACSLHNLTTGVSQGRGTEHEGDRAGHEGDRAIFISSGRETKSTNRGGHIDGQRDAVPPAPGTGDTSHTNERSTWANP